MGVKSCDYFEYDLLATSREIFIAGEVNNEFYIKLLKNLSYLRTLNNEPITIYMNSDGGDLCTGVGIYDFIKSLPMQIKIVVLGEACSAAGFILQAADKRYISKHSIIMLHEWSTSIDNNGTNVRNHVKINDAIIDKIVDAICTRCKLTKNSLSKNMKNDWFLTSDEAIAVGLADYIYE